MVAFLGITFVLLIIVWRIYRFFKPNLYKLQDLYSSIPEYALYYQSAIEVPSYFNAQQSPSFAKDKVEQTIFYSTVFKALLTNNCLKTRLINPNNMHFVCLAANAAAKAIEYKKGSIREQYNFACAIVCLLAKKSAFKHNVEGYCSNKIAEILDNQINILSIFEFRSEYYTEDLQVNNRNLALSCSNYDEISLKSEVDSAKLQSQSTAHNNGNKENSNLPTQQTPATTLNTQSTNQNKLDDSLSSDTKKDIVSGNKELATQRISPTTAKDSVSATPKQSPAKALSDTVNEPVISDWSLESHYKEKDGSQSFANTQDTSSTLYQEQEHARAQSLAKAQEQEQRSAQTQTQESIIVRQNEEERIKSAYENLSSNRNNFRLLDVSYFNKSALEALEYLEKNIRSLSRVGLSNMSENIKKPLEDFVRDGLKQNKLYEAAQKIEKQDEILLQTIYAFSWAISHINPNRYEQQIFTLEAIIGCLYFKCFDDAYSSTAVIKSYLNEIKESDGLNDNQASNTQHSNSSDIGSSSYNYPEQDYDYAQETVNRLNIRDSSVNKVVYNAFKQFTAEQHNYIEDLQHYSLQKAKAMELLKTNLSSIVSLSEHMLDEESKAKFIQFVHDKLNEYHLYEDAKELYLKDSLKQQVVNYFSFAMFLAQGNLQEQKIFALEAMLICCFYDGFETIEDYINLTLSESFDSENELESDAIANQNNEPASQESYELSSDQSNQDIKDRLEPDMSLETATKPEHEQNKAMEQSSSQSSISNPDSDLKPNSQALNANSSLESTQTMASDNRDQSNQDIKDRSEPDMPLETATKPEHEQTKAMEQSSSQSSISKPDSDLKPSSQAINANSSLESASTTASDNRDQSNQDIKDRFEPDMPLETATKPEHEQTKAMEQSSSQSSISNPDSGLKPNSQTLNANSSLESAQTIASQTSHQPESYLTESSSSSIRQSSNSGSGYGSGSGYRSVSNLGASSAHGNSNSLARNMHSSANSISSGSGSGNNNNRNTVVVLRRNISANKKGSLTNLGLSEQYDKYANSGLSITRSPQKPYKYLNQRQYNDIQHKSNDLDTPPKTAPRVFTANKPSSSLYEDISNDIRSSKGYNTTTFRPKQNLEAYAPSEEEIFKLSNSNPTSKKHDLSNIRRLCIEENRTPSWFRRKPSWIKDKDNSVFANWLHDVLRDQFDIDLNKLSIDQQQLIAQVALGLASSMENAGGEREVQMIYIKNFFRQKFTKEQIESFNKLQDYLEHI
ncbi:hypothetical protein MXE38_01140 [Anaerobiospirillum sp. NML120448]|uniref:hypothetical protein n=1 Tax=Anaerobiospirillum sp. NML120448 TaxID=2932816 RepID=UPI001FF34A86|nr:hypothetical protein [Anaerobiospirillum sp. NML120448]MCK0513482.1 hypothetical protein [Anaerobiospirillum sp. NML120448]